MGKPVYYISRLMKGLELRYSTTEKDMFIPSIRCVKVQPLLSRELYITGDEERSREVPSNLLSIIGETGLMGYLDIVP